MKTTDTEIIERQTKTAEEVARLVILDEKINAYNRILDVLAEKELQNEFYYAIVKQELEESEDEICKILEK